MDKRPPILHSWKNIVTIASLGGSAFNAPTLPPQPNSTPALHQSPLTPAAQEVEPHKTLEKQSIKNLPGGAIAEKLRTAARNNKATQDKPSWLSQAVYTDPSFSGQTIAKFASELLKIPEKDLEKTLFAALSEDRQTPESQRFIKLSLP